MGTDGHGFLQDGVRWAQLATVLEAKRWRMAESVGAPACSRLWRVGHWGCLDRQSRLQAGVPSANQGQCQDAPKCLSWCENVLTWRAKNLDCASVCGWGHSSVGRASEWHSEGQEFNPPWLHHLPNGFLSTAENAENTKLEKMRVGGQPQFISKAKKLPGTPGFSLNFPSVPLFESRNFLPEFLCALCVLCG